MSSRNVLAAVGLAFLAFLLSMASPSPGSSQAPGLPETGFSVGEPFPSLALPALEDGRPRSVADFRGRKLILHVFASW